MEQPHKNEMHRLADAEEGTEVWCQHNEVNGWELISIVAWSDNFDYIVDDEWAQIRKAMVDGKTIECKSINGDWVPTVCKIGRLAGDDVVIYRIKPDVVEEVFYYQYEKLHAGRIDDTCHVSEDRANRSNYTEANGWFKIESSKRTWEH